MPAHRVHVSDGQPVLQGSLGDHILTEGTFAGVEWRCVDIDDQLGPSLALHRGWAHRVPDVFTDVDAYVHSADAVDRAFGALLEVALLVEHTVIGQEYLVISVHQLAAITQGGGVGDLGSDFFRRPLQGHDIDVAQDHGDATRGCRDLCHSGNVVDQERFLEEKVFRGVAGGRQLREGHKVGPSLSGAFQVVQDLGGVPGDVTNRWVDLRQGQAEGPCHLYPRVGLCRVYRLPNGHANRIRAW